MQFIKVNSKQLKSNLQSSLTGESIEEIARATGFVKRKSLLTGNRILELLLNNCLAGNLLSLTDLAIDFESYYGDAITKQGIDGRFNACTVTFLKGVLSHMMTKQSVLLTGQNKKSPFTSFRIKDSSRFKLPDEYADVYKGFDGAAKARSAISIQHEFDLLTGKFLDLKLTSACRNDQQDSKESIGTINQENLFIRDLGYITTTFLSNVSENNAFFLNRLPTQMCVYDDTGEKINFKKVLRK